jgi:hypothetical protein
MGCRLLGLKAQSLRLIRGPSIDRAERSLRLWSAAEETIMPKRKKELREPATIDETQKLYARAYASRFAKQVAQQLENSRRRPQAGKKREGKA